MSKQKNLGPLAAAAGLALVASALSVSVQASVESNPFEMQVLQQGYQLGNQLAEGSCGEGKADEEGKCGGEKSEEGKCGEEKTEEGKCGGEKSEEGKCGEGKCGQ